MTNNLSIIYLSIEGNSNPLFPKLDHITEVEKVELLQIKNLSTIFNSNSLNPAIIVLNIDDKSINHTEISHLLRIKYPYSRQVLYITQSVSEIELMNLKNYGNFNYIISDNLNGEALDFKVKKILADYMIVKILGETLKNPLRDTPAYEIMNQKNKSNIEFLGYIVSVNSVVKFADIKNTTLKDNDILLGAYLSAISEKMIYSGVKNDEPWILNLGSMEFVIHESEDILYIFIYRNLTDSDRVAIIRKMKKFTNKIYKIMGEKLLYDSYILHSDIDAITEEINNFSLAENVASIEFRIPNFIFIDPPSSIQDYLEDFPDRIRFSVLPSISQLEILIKDKLADIVCIKTDATFLPPLLEKLEYYYRITPAMHVILYLTNTEGVDLYNLFESKVVDYLLLEEPTSSQWETIIELATGDTITSQLYDLNIPRLYLKKSLEKYITATFKERGELYIPIEGIELSSIFIYSGRELQFYYTWEEQNPTLTTLYEDMENFILSFQALSIELSESTNHILFEFGEYTILYYQNLILDYVIILKEANPMKYNEEIKYLQTKSFTISEFVIEGILNQNAENTYESITEELDSIYFDLLTLSI